MKKQLKWPTLLLLPLISVCSLSAHSAENYGFSAGIWPCPLWSTLFPMSFRVTGDDATRNFVKPKFNILYITDNRLKSMDDFYDLYDVYGDGNNYIWPTSPDVTNGRSTAYCQKDGDCVTKGYGSVGKGISAYNNLKAEFPNEVKVFSGSAYSNGDISWLFLPTRKLKLLRVEYFTPYTDSGAPYPFNINSYKYRSYVEPLFFEYRATGNGDELKIKESGGTVDGANFINVRLPEYIKLSRLSAIQVWLDKVSNSSNPWQRIYPSAKTVDFTDSQKALIPANCQ